MSSWYIFNAMGFYPVNPASAEYIIGSPLYDKVEVQFPQSDHVLTISANGASDKMYVKSVMVDGNYQEIPVLKHSTVLKSSEIVFEMSDSPQLWGKNTL
jgi:putative alpha-1,2-mannosidase